MNVIVYVDKLQSKYESYVQRGTQPIIRWGQFNELIKLMSIKMREYAELEDPEPAPDNY